MNRGARVCLSSAGIDWLKPRAKHRTRMGTITGHTKSGGHYVRWDGQTSSFAYHRDLLRLQASGEDKTMTKIVTFIGNEVKPTAYITPSSDHIGCCCESRSGWSTLRLFVVVILAIGSAGTITLALARALGFFQ